MSTETALTDIPTRRRGARPSGSAPRPAGTSAETHRPRQHWYQLWFALPAIALVVCFFFIPFIANAVFAFTDWTGYSSNIKFNGLDNFKLLVNLGILAHATAITIIYAIVSMIVQNVAGLSLAKALQQTNRINSVFRSIYFIPVLISPLAAGYIWSALLTPNGAINNFIGLFVPGFSFNWLGNSVTALILVASIDAWKWSGMVTLVYIAGLNRIPRSTIEAAAIDGAGPWRRFWGIEMPLLAPAFTFNIVVTLVGAFGAFDVIFSTTGGGPGNATSVLNVAVWQEYGQGLFGNASALSFMITLLVIITAVPLLAWLRKREASV